MKPAVLRQVIFYGLFTTFLGFLLGYMKIPISSGVTYSGIAISVIAISWYIYLKKKERKSPPPSQN